MLPPPTLSFTIPSVHDQLALGCRIYHPTCLAPTAVAEITEWTKKAVIVAHPYAPLGGCYDDPVVDLVASTILKQGFVVGTFNFRGAGNSKGKTSWQSKPEQCDYISFLGFMIYYLHQLSAPSVLSNPLLSAEIAYPDPKMHNLSPIQSQAISPSHQDYDTQYLTPSATRPISTLEKSQQQDSNSKPVILLAGYSYGALITCCLPPITSSITAPFQTPLPGSAYFDIRLRAASLASQQNDLIASRVESLILELRRGRSLQIADHKVSSPKIRTSGGNVRMGGDEDIRRRSHESYRSRTSFSLDSPDLVKKSVDKIRSMGKAGRFPPHGQDSHGSIASSLRKKDTGSESSIEQAAADDNRSIKAIPDIDKISSAYLLISPLHGWVHSLATIWSAKLGRERDSISEHEMKFKIDPTLAIFGDDDVFVSVKKLRAWAEKISVVKGKEECRFRHREISGAGHFWHDYEAVQVMRKEVKDFVKSLR